jgi:hypothetical protein
VFDSRQAHYPPKGISRIWLPPAIWLPPWVMRAQKNPLFLHDWFNKNSKSPLIQWA